MNKLLFCTLFLSFGTILAQSNDYDQLNFIFPKGNLGPESHFTGNAFNVGLVYNQEMGTIVGNVYFEPGARSNWHLHPSGQILIITDGEGYHQIEGETKQLLKKGDVVECPAGKLHWHGASPKKGMQQMYILTKIENGIVEWKDVVSDEEYNN